MSSRGPKQAFQTLSNPISSRKIDVRSDSGGDIGSGGLLNVVNEIGNIVPWKCHTYKYRSLNWVH